MSAERAGVGSGSNVVIGLGIGCFAVFAALVSRRASDVEGGARGLAAELGAVESAGRASRLARAPGWQDDALTLAIEAASLPMRRTQKTSPTIVEALASSTAAALRVRVA